MRMIILAAALSVSGIAIAQTQSTTTDTTTQPTTTDPATQPTTTEDPATQSTTTDTATQPSGQTVDDPSQSTGPQGITQQGTDPNGQATAPVGTNQAPATGPVPSMTSPMTPRPATGEYPPCSRTVTDNCTQTYERGVRRPRR